MPLVVSDVTLPYVSLLLSPSMVTTSVPSAEDTAKEMARFERV